MKYQNTRLTEKISLVKYDGNNCLHQERVELLESDLRDWVIHGPEIFSERSTCQPYLVFEEESLKREIFSLAIRTTEKKTILSTSPRKETRTYYFFINKNNKLYILSLICKQK